MTHIIKTTTETVKLSEAMGNIKLSETIKPCPFCGGVAVLEEDVTVLGARFSVGCANAGEADCVGYQSLTTFGRRSDAVKAWNRRAGDIK